MTRLMRKLNPQDLQAFKQIRLEALQTNPESFGSNFAREMAYEDSKFLQLMVSDDSRYILGMFDDDALVSTMGVFSPNGSPADVVAIWGVYTMPEFRGQKISKQILLRVIEDAKSNPALNKIQLGVTDASVAAQALYKSAGFETYAVEADAIVHGELSMCEILMELDVKTN